MSYLLGTTTVADFEEWHSSFHDNESYRAEHGERGYQVFQSVDDPNDVTVLFEWDEGEDPRAFFESEGMRKRMSEAGVTGRPDMSVLELIDEKSSLHPSA